MDEKWFVPHFYELVVPILPLAVQVVSEFSDEPEKLLLGHGDDVNLHFALKMMG